MSNQKEVKGVSSGISFMGLLAILFIGLKLTNFITWSWWLVLLPIWSWFALFIFALIIILLINLFLE